MGQRDYTLGWAIVVVAIAGGYYWWQHYGLKKPSSAEIAPSHHAVLMVTWFVPGQSAATTQTQMSDMAACSSAVARAVQAGQDIKMEITSKNLEDANKAHDDIRAAAADAQYRGRMLAGISLEDQKLLQGRPVPTMTAYCVQQ